MRYSMIDLLNGVHGCKRCWKKFGNPGILTIFGKTDSDIGGYYPAHVHCDQCQVDGSGRLTPERAVDIWNRKNPKTSISPIVYRCN